jgi:hypothetical protein
MAVVLNEKYRPGSSTYSLLPPTASFVFFPVYATVICPPSALNWWVDLPIDS